MYVLRHPLVRHRPRWRTLFESQGLAPLRREALEGNRKLREKSMSTRMKTAIAAALLLAGGAGHAQEPPAQAAVATLSADADLVFQGTVTDIQYATSIEGIPHTFVTYRVEDVLKGSYGSPTLTLRFIGGVKIEGNVLRKLSVSHAPTFEAGQQDLLMVKGNAQTQCPLVRCAQGRFRFQHGMVTNEEGSSLALEPGGEMVTLSQPVEPAGAGDFGAGTRVPAQADSRAVPLDRASFVAHVRQTIGQQGLRAAAVVQSADPTKPFRGPAPAVSGPPRSSVPARLAVTAPQSERDRQELEALRRNGGNPVLPKKDVETLRRLPMPPASGTPR